MSLSSCGESFRRLDVSILSALVATGQENDQRDGDRGRHAEREEKLEIRFLAVQPALRFVLEQRLKRLGQSRRALRVAHFVDDHRSGKGFAQKRLRDAHMRINPAGINHAHAAPGDRRHGEAPIFATGRKQLNRVARAHFERVGEP